MLSRLKEYRDFIAILVFFLGGFFWIDNEFPKKTDLKTEVGTVEQNLTSQVTELQCIVDQYMRLTQLQIRARELEKDLDRAWSDWEESQAMLASAQPANLSPAMQRELDLLNAEKNKLHDDLDETLGAIDEVRLALERQSCRRVV